MMNKATLLFILYSLAIVATFITHPFTLKTDIMDIAPSVHKNSQTTETLDRLLQAYTNRVNVLFGAQDLRCAKDAGICFKDMLAGQPIKIDFLLDEGGNEILDILSAHNHRLLSESTASLLENKDYSKVRDKALAMLYGPVNAGLLPLEQDPFFLASDFMMNLGLTKSNFFPSHGVLSVSRNGIAYAYMTIELEGFSPAYLLPVIEKIKSAEVATLARFPDVSIYISGVPLHSARAISKSVMETNIIAGVSILLVFLISYAIFRSTKCFLFAMLTIGISVALAFMLSALIFGEIHILVVVFGACLISLCIDYHLHYFAERGYTGNPWSNIGRAVGISLATSMTGFVVMMFAGIPILLQMAVFAIIGLANTYVIIRFFYPPLLNRSNIRAISPVAIRVEKRFERAVQASLQKYFFLKIAIIIIVSGVGILQIEPGDNLKNLYKPEKSLIEKETFFAEIGGTASAPVMFIINGKSQQEVLEKEEELRLSLDGFNYRAISQALPSYRKQNKNYALIEALYKSELDGYLAMIGAPHDLKRKIEANFTSQKDRLLSIEIMPEALRPLFSNNSSVVLIENAQDKSKLADVAEQHGVIYIDRFQEISQMLKKLRGKATLFCILTLTLVFCAITLVYRSPKRASLMIAPSFLSVLMTLGLMGFLGAQISLFDILALFLVVCFGVDYVVFRVERKDRAEHTGITVALSCLTTIISFGALGLTSFAVTKALGLTLSLGLAFSYLLSPIATMLIVSKEA